MSLQCAALASCVLAAAGAAPAAMANEVGFYIGGYYGQASKEAQKSEFDEFAMEVYDFYRYTPAEVRNSFDDKDSTFAILVGYRINRYLAVEGAYTNLGSLAYHSTSSGAFPNDQGTLGFNVESETTGFEVSVLGVLPLTRNWELFGRAGALFATNALTVNLAVRGEIFATPGGDSIRDSFSESSTEWLAGAGASMRFLEMYDLRLEYQRVFDAGKEQTGGIGDIDALMLGITATF